MTLSRLPLVIWALMFAAILGVLAFPALLSAAVLLEFDRLLDTSFFLNNIVINGELLAYKGGSPILYQHLFWFLEHPGVYHYHSSDGYCVGRYVCSCSQTNFWLQEAMLISMANYCCIIGFFIVGTPHVRNGHESSIGCCLCHIYLACAIFINVKTFNWITTLWRSNLRLTVPMLFCISCSPVYHRGVCNYFPWPILQ